MKIVVTGANGQLGRSLKKISDSIKADWIFTDIDELDITNKASVLSFLKNNSPAILINCAAYTAVDKAETDYDNANKINHFAVKNIAIACQKTNCKLIHISTDYVFDGNHYKPYIETDACKPVSIYGKTKLSGEQATLENTSDAMIIRTSWLYSEFGGNFMKTMLKLGETRDNLNVVFDQVGSPTYAGSLAEGILQILKCYQSENTWEAGIYHFSNQGVCSWYDFAKWIMGKAKYTCQVHPITTDQYPTPAKRPFYSVLDKSKFEKTYQYRIPHWTDAAAECLASLLL